MRRIECVVFDTSAILLMFLEKVRVVEQVVEIMNSPIIPIATYPVVMELYKLSRGGKPRIIRAARSAFNYVINNFAIVRIEASPDDSVLEAARRFACAAVTCDMKLLNRLRSAGIRTIYLRESSFRMEADFE